MSVGSAVGLFGGMSEAEEAVRRLSRNGFPMKQVSIVARNLESKTQIHGYITAGDIDKEGAAAETWLGGLFGMLVGAAFVWMPGFGPLFAAGPLAPALSSGIEGALAGATGRGILGGLVGWGASRQQTLKYEKWVMGGKYLVIAQGNGEEVARASEILKEADVEELDVHP